MIMKKLFFSTKNSSEAGFFTTALVLTSVTVVGIILVASSTRSWFGAKAVARQGLANAAREAAEAGAEIIIEDSNSNCPYRLVVDQSRDGSEWADAEPNSTLCDGNSPDPNPTLSGDVGSSGTFSLEDYDFVGNPIYGGTGVLKVKGTASNNSITSTAIIEQKFKIIPKICSKGGESSCAGLYADKGEMKNNDVRGLGGNVHFGEPSACSSLPDSYLDYDRDDKECAVGGKANMVVDGEIFIGPTTLPPVETYTFPESVTAAEITGNETIDSSAPPDYCVTEDNITHCKVDSINIGGTQKLIIDTSSGNGVRIYVSGDIDVKGNAYIEHEPSTADAAKVGLFGNPTDTDDSNDQNVDVRGTARITNVFLYFPDGKVGIRGGGGSTASCSSTGECSGGNIHGAVWAKEWGRSGSNVAEVTVPGDWCEQVEQYYGSSSRVGNRSFVARGPVSFKVLKIDE